MKNGVSRGIVFRAPAGVSVTLFREFGGDEAVAPDRAEEKDGERFASFETLAPGRYHYIASGEGYYTVDRALWASEEKIARGVRIDADPGKTAGKGWEATGKIDALTEEMEKSAVTLDPAVLAGFAPYFTTPTFTKKKAAHEFTTQEEMTDFLASLDDPAKHARQYVLATTGAYGYAVPIVVFTKADLSGCDTFQAAAEKVRANGRPTVHVQAQIHGNEPAAGEGALVLIGRLCADAAWREALLDSVNIVVVPRVNPDGARDFTRKEVCHGVNMNRDFYAAETPEVCGLIAAKLAFDPAVSVDMHEFTLRNALVSGVYNDVLLMTSDGVNTCGAVKDLGLEIAAACFERLSEKGFRVSGYPASAARGGGYSLNGFNPTLTTAYFGSDGAVSILVETRGIRAGRFHWERRVASQFVSACAVIEEVARRAGEVKKTVAARREAFVRDGAKFDPARLFSLETRIGGGAENIFAAPRPVFDYATGAVTDEGRDAVNVFYDTAVRSRPRATAYVLPKGEAWEKDLTRFLEIHAVRYYEIAPGASARLCGYTGTEKEACLTEEKVVSFPKGAVAIPLGQIRANVAAYLCEPDVTDVTEGAASLFRMAKIAPVDGVFPIWRFQGDLDENGKIPLKNKGDLK